MNTIDIGPMNSFQAESLIADLEKENVPFEVLEANSQEFLFKSNQFGQAMDSNLVLVRMERDTFSKHLSLLERYGFNLITKVYNPQELESVNLPDLEKINDLPKPEILENCFNVLRSLFWILFVLSFTELKNNQFFKNSYGLVLSAFFVCWLIRLSKKNLWFFKKLKFF